MKKIKIGIFIRDFKDLSDTEFRIYQTLLESHYCEISLLIKDGRKKIKKKISRFLSFNIFTKSIFFLINKIDNYFFDKNFLTFKNKKKIISKLKKIKVIYLNPEKRKFIDFFDENESNKIFNYKLDIILRNEFNIIKGKILNIPKHGIWSFHHGDNDYYRGGPAGFWEVYNEEETTGVTLQILNNTLDGGRIIDKCKFPTQQTFLRNNAFILEKSKSILMKNIKILSQYSKVSTKKSKTKSFKIYRLPNRFHHSIYYCYILIKNILLKKIINKFFYLLNYQLNVWSLFIVKNDIFSSNKIEIKPILPPKNYFFADPFLINNQKKEYVFFENFSYKENKGKISCGLLKNDNLIDIKDILISKKHYSYPFIFYYKKNYYLLPESYQSKRLEIYISTNFPYKWKLYSSSFQNEYIADPSILNYKNNLWLFINKSSEPFNDLSSELYIYKISDLKLTKIVPHKKNPVIIDSTCARNAGNFIFKNKSIYRPSQSNIKTAYGHSINLSKINKLSLDDYEETRVKIIKPEFYKNLVATHHVSSSDKKYIIDGCIRFYK